MWLPHNFNFFFMQHQHFLVIWENFYSKLDKRPEVKSISSHSYSLSERFIYKLFIYNKAEGPIAETVT